MNVRDVALLTVVSSMRVTMPLTVYAPSNPFFPALA